MTLEEIRKRERDERVKRGLPPDHILSFDEFPFLFATDVVEYFDNGSAELLGREPNSDIAVFYRMMAMLMRKDYDQANLLMERYQKLAPSKQPSRMRFGLEPSAASIELPQVVGNYPTKPCFFLCADEKYFRNYGVALLRSMADKSPSLPVHIHLFSEGLSSLDDVSKLNLDLSSSFENPSQFLLDSKLDPATYFNSVRFVRFAEALENNPGPLWISDVDGLVTDDPKKLLSSTGSAAMRVRAGRLEPWNQYSACLVIGTASSLPYFRRVAAILKADLPTAWWAMDQYALFSAAIGTKPEITLIGPDLAGVEDNSPGLFWYTAGGNKKYLHTADSPYAALFRKYALTN